MSTVEIFELLEKASEMLTNSNGKTLFQKNFPEIKEIIAQIPGHEELVQFNEISTLEEWQLNELKTTLIEQLKKTKDTWTNLKRTGYEN